uniref:Chemokine interleukin-8-like domain-containing protein n=1 Tax=Varanus komodoensis TaxID=61221 RepID=A0A8D2ITH8_VARKO
MCRSRKTCQAKRTNPLFLSGGTFVSCCFSHVSKRIPLRIIQSFTFTNEQCRTPYQPFLPAPSHQVCQILPRPLCAKLLLHKRSSEHTPLGLPGFLSCSRFIA